MDADVFVGGVLDEVGSSDVLVVGGRVVEVGVCEVVGRGGVVVSVDVGGGGFGVPVGTGSRVGRGACGFRPVDVADVEVSCSLLRDRLVLSDEDTAEPDGRGGGGSTGGADAELVGSGPLELDPGVWIVMSGPALGC